MPVELKKSPYLFAYAAFLVAVSAALVWQKVLTVREAGILITGALAFPGLIGAGGKKPGDDDDKDPPPPAAGGSTPLIITPIMLIAFVLGMTACKPGQAPRETARATVLVVADAVKQLDAVCATLVLAKHDAALGQRCAAGYDVARAALIGSEKQLDAYDSARAGEVACAIKHAVEGLQSMVDALRSAGGKPPPIADDAFALAPALTGACRG